jgi:hypothetical protein
MDQKTNVEIFFKIEGLETYITDLETLNSVLKQVSDNTKDVKDETKELEDSTIDAGKSADKSSSGFKKIGTVGASAFKALKTAIAATGIGLLLTAIGSLVQLFTETDTGAKILRGTTAALGIVFDKLVGFVTNLGTQLKPLFTNPKQALIDFGNLLKENLINRFTGILNLIPALGTAVKLLFEGEFKKAGKVAADAVIQITTGIENGTDKIGDLVDGVSDFVSELTEDIGEAINQTNSLVDAENRFAKLQNTLLVENAKLKKSLEEQKKIAEDTTRAYEERKAALDEVNKANEQIALNVLKEAKANEALIRQRINLAKTDEERRTAEAELAQAIASRIQAEQEVGVVRLESERLGRELDVEERDRLKGIADLRSTLNQELITDEKLKIEETIRLAREAAIAELEVLRASEEEKNLVNQLFDDLRTQQLKELQDRLDQEQKDAEEKSLQELQALRDQYGQQELDAYRSLQDAKLGILNSSFELAQSLAGDNQKLQDAIFVAQKAYEAAQVFIKGRKEIAEIRASTIAATAQLTAQSVVNPAALGLIPVVQAAGAANINAVRLNTAAGIASILAASITRFKGGGGGGLDTPGVNNTGINPQALLDQRNSELEGGGGGTAFLRQRGDEPVRAYVVLNDINNAQQINNQILNLSKL